MVNILCHIFEIQYNIYYYNSRKVIHTIFNKYNKYLIITIKNNNIYINIL